jgi:hypothetical protein
VEGYVRVAVLDNEIEAMLLKSILEERGIPHSLESYHDTAYDGLFQAQKGWGAVWVPSARERETSEILEDVRSRAHAEEDSGDF